MEFIRALGELPIFWGLFDPGWWNVMLDTTTSGHYSPEATILTLGVFVVAGVCIALGLLVKIRFHRESAPSISSIDNPGKIRALLETALTQRSKMRVSFVRDDPGSHSTDATILSVDRVRGIELEMTSMVKASQSWIGKLVACDFRLRLDPRRDYHNFFAFVVPVRSITKAGDEFIHMTVAWPARLDLEQKRAFLRIEPPRPFLLGLALWPEIAGRGGKGRLTDPESWGEPLVRFDPDVAGPAVELSNISGGGVRLDIQAAASRRQAALFELGARFLMRLRLDEPETGEPLDFYLALRLQNIYGDPEASGHKAYGFRFLSFGPPAATDKDVLSWKSAAGGVPAIDDWVFRRHLEIYRARGDA